MTATSIMRFGGETNLKEKLSDQCVALSWFLFLYVSEISYQEEVVLWQEDL